MTLLKTSAAKFAAAVAGAALVLTLGFSVAMPAQAALTESQIQSILSLLQSFGADASVVGNVEASLRGTTPTGGTGTGTSTGGTCSVTFSRNLNVGSTGADVLALQQWLNANGFVIAASGAGSPGNETQYYGSLTAAAVGKYQAANAASILTPLGLSASGVPYPFGPATRNFLNANCGSTGTGTGTGTGTTPTGTGLSVSAGSQPQNALAPQGATHVPFTRITLTAGNDGAVTVNSLTVQRVGLGQNAAFSGVVLLDENGQQLGTAKSFNSNDQATIGESVTIPAGTSKTFTIAGNMASSLASYAGEAPAISVVAVNTGAAVSGSLPVTGAYHTINATLTTGTLSFATSNAYAANATSTKEIGTTAFRATGFSLTAGSAEDIRLTTLRFNQTGSASTKEDIANIQVGIDGTLYPATVSADGKYITANLGSGIVIPEGNKVEVYVQYDIIGSNANNRTVKFDIDESTDIVGKGMTYGYGVPVSGGASGTPYYYGTTVTISGASVTTISKATSVAAQNIAVNVPNQPLGGFEVDIKGEAITVQSITMTVASSSGSGTGQLTNVTIVDENGTVVAGPVDTSGAGTTLTFTDSVTFMTGKHTYTIRGKVASTIGNGTQYTITLNPSTGFNNPKGDITGDSITISQGAFTMNTMTVKTAALVIGRATSPASQTLVAGGSSVHMMSFTLDASQSGEDVRLSSFPAVLDVSAAPNSKHGAPNYLSSCQLFDGSTALNTGSNVVNPSGTATSSDSSNTFTFDNPVTIAKGTVKTLGVKCNLSSSIPGLSEYVWDHAAPGALTASTFSATGATSGNAITETEASDNAIVVTIGSGSVAVNDDAAAPSYTLVSAGATDVTVNALRFRATNEGINLQKLGLQLGSTASSSASDIVKVSIYDGATKVGEAYFTGTNTTATSTLTSTVQLPKDTDKTLTLKVDLGNIGTSQAATSSGHLVRIEFLNAEGTGVESGTTQNAFTDNTGASSGVRVFKSFPTVALDTLPSTGVQDGRLMRFKVTADSAGPISISNFALNIATTSGVGVQNLSIYGYTDSNYSLPISGVSTDGNLQATSDCASLSCTNGDNVSVGITNGSGNPVAIQIPAGGTRYFEVRASVSGIDTGDSITTKLLGNSAFPSTASIIGGNFLVATSTFTLTTDFVWSPNSTTTPSNYSADWTSGFGVPGLPSSGLIQTRSQ